MPVPVPVQVSPKFSAHPVYKAHPGRTLPPLNSILFSALGGPRDSSTRPRRIWEEDQSVSTTYKQDFHKGLAFADNAYAIKGSLTQVRKPPLPPLFPPMQPHHSASWPAQNSGSATLYRTSEPRNLAECDKGAFSPVYEEESPEVLSSPMEPVTPFGVFIDRAVASNDPAIVDSSLHQWNHDSTAHAHQQLCEPGHVQENYDALKPDISSTHVETPSATAEYRRLAEYFSDWISKFVWKVCTTGMALPGSYARPGSSTDAYSETPPQYLSESVYSLLLSTLLEPSAILLALWYIARLPVYFAAMPLALDKEREAQFRTHLLGDSFGSDREATQSTAPFRLIVLGFMFSNKWLSDHTYSNKTWHNISDIPISYLNSLESLALGIFGYDLSISDENWSKWLTFILSYHTIFASPGYPQPISRPTATSHGLIRKSIEDVISAASSRSKDQFPQPVFTGLEERRRVQREKANAAKDAYDIDLDEDGPLRKEYIPRRHSAEGNMPMDTTSDDATTTTTTKQFGQNLPPPAKWSPAADEPVLRDSQRINGHLLSTYPMYTTYHSYEQNPELCSNQNWPAGGYIAPMKQIAVPTYGLPAQHHHLPPQGYNHISFVQSLAMSHSRSHSLSYGQDNITTSRNHLRSSSQAGHDIRNGAYNANAAELSPQDNPWGVAQHKFIAPVFPSGFTSSYNTSWLAN